MCCISRSFKLYRKCFFIFDKKYLSSAMLPMGVALFAYVNSHMRHGHGLIKNLSMKSDFSQTRLSRSGFDSECEAFHSELILKLIRSDSSDWSDV